MIKMICQKDIIQCVNVIRTSFKAVAKEFGITKENAPGYTAFATDEKRITHQLIVEHRPMYGYFLEDRLIGYYSLCVKNDSECELNNLSVLPEYQHKKIGYELLEHSFEKGRELNCSKMCIGIVEENKVLRKWYENYGFVHVGTEKFEFFPFTCGYMEKTLE